MARLYANENFPRPVVEELRRLGHDVMTVVEAGNAGQGIPDEEVLEFAVGEDRAVLTLNRKHFMRLYKVTDNHSGIIVCTVDADFAGQAGRIHAAIDPLPALGNQLIRVNRP